MPQTNGDYFLHNPPQVAITACWRFTWQQIELENTYPFLFTHTIFFPSCSAKNM